MATRVPCPACTATGLRPFHRVEGVPVNSCRLVPDEATAQRYARGELVLAWCPTCGFIANTAFQPGLSTYSADYEETQAFSPVFRTFIADLAQRWTDRYGLADKSVIEIGCGKGEFLAEMIRAGVATGVGIDPGVHEERIDADVLGRTSWVAGMFPDAHPQLDAAAVICRHTLEHVAPVREFMTSIRTAIGDRSDTVVLFELPDVARVLEEAAFWDVYYEHCSYFSTGSLARLFRSTGFEVLDVWLAYDDQYIIIEARPGPVPAPGRPLPIEDDLARLAAGVDGFVRTYDEVVGHWSRRLREVAAAAGSSVIWGSGSKGVAFLSALGPDAKLVEVAVDVNPYKHGRFMAGSGHRIVAPEELLGSRPDLVIAMNSAYLDEIGRDLARLGIETRLEAV